MSVITQMGVGVLGAIILLTSKSTEFVLPSTVRKLTAKFEVEQMQVEISKKLVAVAGLEPATTRI